MGQDFAMKNLILAFLSLLITTLSFAGPMDNFAHSLKSDYYFTKTERAIELNNHVRITKFGILGRIFSPDAAATYNDKLNVISLHADLVEKIDGVTYIKDARQIRGAQYTETQRLSTIFHEMGHAEMDVFIENGREAEDMMLMNHYKYLLKPWYKKHFPKFNPHIAFHEHFGYYRGELMDFLLGEIDTLLTNNGFNKFRNSCFKSYLLKQKLAEGATLEEFKNLYVTDVKNDFYRTKISPHYIFVKGKDIDLRSAPDSKMMLMQTHNLFWGYHQAMYNFPMNQTDLVKRMNEKSHFKKTIADCRTKMWEEARTGQ